MRSPGSSLISSRGVKWCWKSMIICVLCVLCVLLGLRGRHKADCRSRCKMPGVFGSPRAGVTAAARSSLRCVQRLVEIAQEIVRILQADRETQQIGRAGRVRALDRGAMLDQAFDAAERGRALPQP